MNQRDPLERDLAVWFVESAQARTPDYVDDILARTARMRQRPAWTLRERWLPMSAVARSIAMARPIPWRTVGLVALLLALLIVGALLAVGSQRRLPAPFGPAANGSVVYSAEGDIYTVDPVTGASRAIVTGSGIDLAPQWSRDGTKFVFERKLKSEPGPSQLYVARADGSGVTLITPQPMAILNNQWGEAYSFSPDGRDVMVVHDVLGVSTISIARADGSSFRTVRLPFSAFQAAYRPPNGTEILVIGNDPAPPEEPGIYLVDPDGANLRTLVQAAESAAIGYARWSPDGSRVSYTTWDTIRDTYPTDHIRIVSADGTGDHALVSGPPVNWEADAVWSNDGTRLAVVRGHAYSYEAVFGAVVWADGRGLVVETAQPLAVSAGCCATQEWAPDDRTVLAAPAGTQQEPLAQQLWDPVTGRSLPTPWTAASGPAWQRLAP
jgi:dipeptidyl aminopeptidase/acylaminoacyl peptidase